MTLLHAISSTSRTAAHSSVSASRTPPTVSSVSDESMNDAFRSVRRVGLCERRGNRLELGSRGIAGHTTIQPCEHLHVPGIAIDRQLVRIRAAQWQRHPELVTRALE